MNVIEIILANLNVAVEEYSQANILIWSVNVCKFIVRLDNHITYFVKNSISTFSDEEKVIYDTFKDRLKRESEFYKKNERGYSGAEISDRFKKIAYIIRQTAKGAGMSIPESAPAVVDGATSGESKSLSERDKKILESIKTIETMLNDLKNLVKKGCEI